MWMESVYAGKLSSKPILIPRPQRSATAGYQINSGTVFGYVVGAVNDSFKLLRGKLSFYTKVADSGAKRELAFCGVCGTRIYARAIDRNPGFFRLRVGAIRQRRILRPKRRAWEKSCSDWVE